MDNSEALAQALAVSSSPRWDVQERYPIAFERSDGPYAWDVEGNRYLDLTSASGAAPLGGRHPRVVAALVHAAEQLGGCVPGTVSPHRTAVADRLAEILPCGERVLFMRTGSCATAAAVRLARAATGRRLVLTSGFHGWHDWSLVARDDAGRGTEPDVIDFGYSLATLERMLDSAERAVAAVFVTPEPAFLPEPYYAELERIVRGSRAVLIYDEVMAGFRYGVGGFHAAGSRSPFARLMSSLTAMSSGYFRSFANALRLSVVHALAPERQASASATTWSISISDALYSVLPSYGLYHRPLVG
jgi:glutamate-1-semialdehyde 2,1-aminomutase